MPWEVIFFGMIKLIKAFGLIPGAIAAFGVRKLYQKWRQNKAMAGWPVTDGTILSGRVHREGRRRYWAENRHLIYSSIPCHFNSSSELSWYTRRRRGTSYSNTIRLGCIS